MFVQNHIEVDLATTESPGVVQPDGTSITIDENGIISSVGGGDIVTWAEGTDSQIAAMVQAADNGDIDLTDYWSVGDERRFFLNGCKTIGVMNGNLEPSIVMMVIVAKDTKNKDNTNPCYKYQYKTATSGRTYPSFIIQQKACTNSSFCMNTYTESALSWNICGMRTWLNLQFKDQVFPSSFLPVIKSVIVRSISGSTMQESDGDYFFLPTEKEIQGERYYSNTTEASEFPQWEYYFTASNKAKKKVNGETSTWWLRSLGLNYNFFCGVAVYGDKDQTSGINNYKYLAPCGCI